MAVSADNLDIILRLIGLRTFQAGMAEAKASVESVGKASLATDAQLASSSGKTMSRMALLKKGAVGIALAIGAVAAKSYSMSLEYQREVEMIHTQAGMSQRDTNIMYSSILDMTRKFPQGPIEMAKGAYHMASVTHDMRKSLEGTAAAAQLAAIGNSNLEDTTSAVAAVWQASRGEGLSFRDIVSTLNATVGAGNMRMQDLVQALGTGVIPVFKTAGLHLQDFGASLALLTDEGQHADNAATHLRMAVNLLAAPSKLARKELKGIGLNALDLADAMKGPNGLIVSLEILRARLYAKYPGPPITEQAAKGLLANPDDLSGLHHAQSQRMNVLSRAFGGARSGATIMALVDQLQTLQGKQKQVEGTTKNFGDALAHTMGLPAVKLHTAISDISVDSILFGNTIRGPVTVALLALLHGADGVLKALRWMVTAVKDSVDWYKKLPGPVHTATNVVLLFGGAVTGLMAIMKAARIIQILWIATWALLTGAVETARIAMYVFVMDNPILLAIAAIIVILILVVKHWKWFKQAGVDAWHWIKKAAVDTWHWIERAADNIWKAIKNMIAKVKKIPGVGLLTKIMSFSPGGFALHLAKGLIPGAAAGGVAMAGGQFMTINESQSGETVWLPGGSSVQPSPAASLAVPRAHTPNPAPAATASPIFEHTTIVQLDRKVLYKAVTRARADDKARRGTDG